MPDGEILGFSVPAYRRPALLDRALESIVAQAKPRGAPIYVPDNSCDATNVAVVTKWQRNYENIIHEVNDTNIGIDRNVERAIARCPAQYVHVIGDDDIIMPGFADNVLSTIIAAAPGHIICSYLYLLNDYRVTSGIPIIPAFGPSPTLRTFLPQLGWTLGFIGAHVFRRDRYIACTAEGYGSYFHHIIKLLAYVDPDESLRFIESPLVGNRVDDESTPTWSGDRLKVVFGLERAFVTAMTGRYSDSEIRQTVASSRRFLGYTEFSRLLYWAALSQRSGEAGRYWETLAQLVPGPLFERLRAVPSVMYGPLIHLTPTVRRLKRYVRRLRYAKK